MEQDQPLTPHQISNIQAANLLSLIHTIRCLTALSTLQISHPEIVALLLDPQNLHLLEQDKKLVKERLNERKQEDKKNKHLKELAKREQKTTIKPTSKKRKVVKMKTEHQPQNFPPPTEVAVDSIAQFMDLEIGDDFEEIEVLESGSKFM